MNPALIKDWNDWHFCVHRPFNLSYDYKYACPLDLRTILKKADIYLLDEPTTNLSIEIANLFLDFLLEIKKKKIVLIIRHDEMVINKADMKIKISKNLVEKVKIMKT